MRTWAENQIYKYKKFGQQRTLHIYNMKLQVYTNNLIQA